MATVPPTPPRPAAAAELRKAAESADGRRGRTLQLAYAERTSGGQGIYIMYDPTDPGDKKKYAGWTITPILDTKTKWTCGPHCDEDKAVVKVTPPGGQEQTLDPRRSDALFWSESAVEKFLFPYYARHLNKKQYDLLYRTYMTVTKNPTTGADQVVMALIHLPSSCYGTTATPTFTEDQKALFGQLYELDIIVSGRPPQSLPSYLFELYGAALFVELQ